MAEAAAGRRRTNRRGEATRQTILDAARRTLASGDPQAASANHIAKLVGATWGAVKYQFGDVDGLWAAVLNDIGVRRGELVLAVDGDLPIEERVTTIVELLWRGLDTPDARAIENLRSSLPSRREELERSYPQTAEALASWQAGWVEACQDAFADLDVDPVRLREVAAFLPGAMRGLTSEEHLGTYSDLDVARRGLAHAIAAYLGRPEA